MEYQHLHQCPECGHTWMCDITKCGGKLYAKDGRCLYGWNLGMAPLSDVQDSGIHSPVRQRRVRAPSGQLVGILP